jgi:hypothetical protein
MEVMKMNDVVKGAIYVAAAAVIVHGVKKDGIMNNESVRNGTIGALGGILAGPKLESLVKGEGLSDEAKSEIQAAVIGGGIGAGLGYVISKFGGDYIAKAKSYLNSNAAQQQNPQNPKNP